ncbi:uncharacterized protein TNCV_2474431 [Trichonephila clavipes]|nr:uncharacterized protein TNCV_2474431 [Trichonephila clavipes]
MFNICRGTWSVHKPDSIVLGVMSLLNHKKLLISEKESLPALICGPSEKFSASPELYEFVCLFFSEKLDFPQLVRLQSKLRFFYLLHRSVAYSLVTSNLSRGTLGFLWTRFWMALRFLEVLTVRFLHFLDFDHHCQAL